MMASFILLKDTTQSIAAQAPQRDSAVLAVVVGMLCQHQQSSPLIRSPRMPQKHKKAAITPYVTAQRAFVEQKACEPCTLLHSIPDTLG
jgi:hypothetical protein